MTASYNELITRLREISLLGSTEAVLGWDERVYMPPKGAEHRSNQLSLLARMVHEQFTAPRVGELLGELEGSDLVADPESDAAVNVRETRRSYDRACKLPSSLVEEMAKVAILAQAAWVEARSKSHYPTFEPWLARTLDLKRQEASCVGYRNNPYDALLDEYEPGETAQGIEQVFTPLRAALVELIGKIVSSPRKAPAEILERKYPKATQEKLARDAAKLIGFDFGAGRLDVTVHPFCTGIGPGDTRITTRYDEHYFGDAFFGVLHETGHALYDQGLPKEHFGTPRADAVSLGIHESQSRLWENLVGRSRAFWRFYYPRVKKAFRTALAGVSEDEWFFAVNDVRPSFIRTEADEATYNLHVMLRFEFEQKMLTGDIAVGDIPAAWNERMKEFLGIVPPNDAQGCLQDVHWSGGAIGYFPTYTLGNLYAAQFFAAARRDLGDLDAMLGGGDFAPLLSWLRENIHRHGRRYKARQLVRKVTGSDLSSEHLLAHLRAKMGELYGF